MESPENNYKHTTTLVKTLAETIQQWLKAFGEALAEYAESEPQRAFGRYLAKYGGSVYEVRGDCVADLKKELTDKGISYVSDMTNPNRIIIKHTEAEEVKALNRQILAAKGNYFQEMDGAEMEDAIARIDKIKDKEIFSIHGLTLDETEVLKNKLNNISQGLTAGISDEDDGKHSVSIAGTNVMSDHVKKDMCRAYLEMSLSLYGQNSDIKVRQLEADRQFMKRIDRIKGKNETCYIAGSGDTNRYIELNGQGFEYYERYMDKKTGKWRENEVKRCSIDDPDFDVELQIYLDRIKDKVMLESATDLSDHLNTSQKNYLSDRPQKSKEEANISHAENDAAAAIDDMIRIQIIKEQRKFDSPAQKFSFYEEEAAGILKAAAEGNSYGSYRTEDFEIVRKAFLDRKVDIKPYADITEKIKNVECETHTAQMKDVVKKEEVKRDYKVIGSQTIDGKITGRQER